VLHDSWASDVPQLTFHRAAGRDHFDVLEELCAPTSVTVRSILQMIGQNAED